MKAVIAIVLVLVIGAGLAACSGSPGHLGADRRVKILEPKPGSTVTNPVTIRWSSTIDPGAESGLWFVVYVDQAMAPPGASTLVAASEPCDDVAACLAQGALDGPNVFLTDQHQIDDLLVPTGAGPEHRLTVVLVDAQGIRQGAVGWNAAFRVD
jgi:hypothetical protein